MSRGLSRRTVLGGAAVALALPWLPSLRGREARAAAGPPPVRLLWWYCPNGMVPDAFWPTTLGDAYAITPTLAPLVDHRSEFTIVSGVGFERESHSPHSDGTTDFLTGWAATAGDLRAGRSVDQHAAAHFAGLTPFPSLQLGVDPPRDTTPCDHDYSCFYTHCRSWADEVTPLQDMTDPRLVFERLFGGSDPGASAAERERRYAQRTSILDVVLEETRDLQGRLGTADTRRLDRYLTSVRELEDRLFALGPDGTCDVGPDAPGPWDDPTARVDRFSDLVALAFACDLTRVITFSLGHGSSTRTYPFLNTTSAHHYLSHHGGDRTMINELKRIERWEMERFAYALTALRTVDDDDGTLLDHTACVLGSEISDGDEHSATQLPVLVAGRAGGALTPGRHVDVGGRAILDVNLTVLAAAGLQLTPWGQGQGPLTELA